MFKQKKNFLKNIRIDQLSLKAGVADWSKTVLNGFMNTIGNTPLVKLEKLSKESGCNILVKCEQLNPGGKINCYKN